MAGEPLTETVWVLYLDYDIDELIAVFRTEAAAKTRLLEYVLDYWLNEFPNSEGIPTDDDEAIQKYFEDNDDESYRLEERNVEDGDTSEEEESS